ncbi:MULTISPECIES: hypothetical protein [Comamonas]|jgi:hypothetical protein|nr:MULTISPECIES: hypothetical protein [Comamonas]MBD9531295.1 hypothetical protein [Comamonas sp. CMM01]MBV7417287.1 hypothetical protein [Comamonas sp. CMM03]MDH0051124.1 hypothetical protein [Comamonas terrigena]MDH0513575.1 hypothetical protein [Comamonas terrigena]MDH1093068.1 hypothetical protein [Comamonas terrigena]
MTHFSAALYEHLQPQQVIPEMPEPRSPEEVMSLLAEELPFGEYSVDAF